MLSIRLGRILFAAACALCAATPAFAAPDRLNDDVPDAAPDQPGAFAASWGHELINLEGALTNEHTVHDYFKLRYTFSPKVAASLRYTRHDLAGGLGLLSPVLDTMDYADEFTVDLSSNMMHVPATPADPANEVEFSAGSSFGMGVSGTLYQLDAGALSQDDTLLKAYLVYTTDLSEEMRAHTYFSTGRIAGDSHTGSINRVAAGLDYTLIDGRRPLVLMANGTLDIFNFRKPIFNTSRISRFDVGLRYRLAEDWYASVGWVTLNDSENDASGSGLFASINFVDEPPPPCDPCLGPTVEELAQAAAEAAAAEQPAVEAAPAEDETVAETPQASAVDLAGQIVAQAYEQPPLMETQPAITQPATTETPPPSGEPRFEGNGMSLTTVEAAEEARIASAADEQAPADEPVPEDVPAPLIEDQPPVLADVPPPDIAPLPSPGPDIAEAATRAVLLAQADTQPALPADEGIAIPPCPVLTPAHTPAYAVMIRPGVTQPAPPRHTSPDDVMLRPPAPAETFDAGHVVADLPPASDTQPAETPVEEAPALPVEEPVVQPAPGVVRPGQPLVVPASVSLLETNGSAVARDDAEAASDDEETDPPAEDTDAAPEG